MAEVLRRMPWLGRALTALAAVLWLAQGFLPMVSSGAFSRSTTLDLVRMSAAGSLGNLLPAGVVVVLLAVPVAGVALFALAPWDERWARVVRAVVLLLGGASVVLQVLALTGGDLTRIGPGASCALVGLALAVVGVLLSRAARRPTISTPPVGLLHAGQPEPPSVQAPTPHPVLPRPVPTSHVSPDELALVGEQREASERPAQEVGER